MAKSNLDSSSPFYRKSSASIPKYAEVQGEKQPVKCVGYKWPGGESGIVGPPVIHNVMGQEDELCEENGVRINNLGTARVIFTTEFQGYSRVKYGIADEAQSLISGTPELSLTEDTGYNNTLSIYHEVFFAGLAVDALYAFQVWSINDEGTERKSDIYYFRTGSEVEYTSGNIVPTYIITNVTFQDVTIDASSSWTAIPSTGSNEATGLFEIDLLTAAKIASSGSHTEDMTEIVADTDISSPF